MPNRLPFLLSLLLASLSLATAFSGEEGFTMGVCVMGMRHPYFKEMLDEIEKDAARAGIAVVAGDADFDLRRQTAIINEYVAKKVSLIMVAPFSASGLTPALNRAREAGIPIMTIDAAAIPGFPVISHCASDNTAGGRLAGGLMLERLAEKGVKRDGTILVFNHVGVTSTTQRVKGFRDVVNLRGSQFKVVVQDALGQTPFALEKTVRAIAEMGDDLVGIFASNDGMTQGALEAVGRADWEDRVVIVGYDFVEEAKQAVDRGRLAGIVVQFPRRIGAAAFTIALDYLTGKNLSPQKQSMIEVGTYTREGFLDQRGNLIE